MPGDWWGGMSVLQRIYGCIGIPIILVLIVWLVLTIMRMIKQNKKILSGNYDIEDRRYIWPIHCILVGLAMSSWVDVYKRQVLHQQKILHRVFRVLKNYLKAENLSILLLSVRLTALYPSRTVSYTHLVYRWRV